MKNKIIISSLILVVLIGVIWLINQPGAEYVPTANNKDIEVSQNQSVQTTEVKQPVISQTSSATKNTSTKTVVTTTATKTTTSSSIPRVTASQSKNYAQYITELTLAQNKCKEVTESQYKQLYLNKLYNSSYQTNYAVSSGTCYAKITGETKAEFSTTTYEMIYFRNVNQNTVLATCERIKSSSANSGDWKCSDKITGKGINYSEFNSLIYKYTTQS